MPSDSSSTSDAAPRPQIAPMIGVICGAFILSQFYRTTVAVLAPELTRALSLTPESLGLLTGAFFIASAAMQIPVGVLLDRYGPRRVLPVLTLTAATGVVIFATAEAAAMLALGQFVIGAGCSGIFMGGLVLVARWFPKNRFATLSSILLAISVGGNLLTGTPLALAAEAFGWRGAILATAGLLLLVSALTLLLVRDAPPGHAWHERKPESLGQAIRAVGTILARRDIRGILAMAFVTYASMVTIRGLWAGPYLADIHGLDTVNRGHVLFAMSLATLVGSLIYGPLDRRFDTRKGVVLSGGLAVGAVLLTLAAFPDPGLPVVIGLFCLLALCGPYYVILLAHGRAFFADHLVGRAMSTMNFFTFAGVGVTQVLTGVVVGRFGENAGGAHPIGAYRAVFIFLVVVLLAALALYASSRDKPPSGETG